MKAKATVVGAVGNLIGRATSLIGMASINSGATTAAMVQGGHVVIDTAGPVGSGGHLSTGLAC